MYQQFSALYLKPSIYDWMSSNSLGRRASNSLRLRRAPDECNPIGKLSDLFTTWTIHFTRKRYVMYSVYIYTPLSLSFLTQKHTHKHTEFAVVCQVKLPIFSDWLTPRWFTSNQSAWPLATFRAFLIYFEKNAPTIGIDEIDMVWSGMSHILDNQFHQLVDKVGLPNSWASNGFVLDTVQNCWPFFYLLTIFYLFILHNMPIYGIRKNWIGSEFQGTDSPRTATKFES